MEAPIMNPARGIGCDQDRLRNSPFGGLVRWRTTVEHYASHVLRVQLPAVICICHWSQATPVGVALTMESSCALLRSYQQP
jgi:hypothetical protein